MAGAHWRRLAHHQLQCPDALLADVEDAMGRAGGSELAVAAALLPSASEPALASAHASAPRSSSVATVAEHQQRRGRHCKPWHHKRAMHAD